jgi:hypothetical protein
MPTVWQTRAQSLKRLNQIPPNRCHRRSFGTAFNGPLSATTVSSAFLRRICVDTVQFTCVLCVLFCVCFCMIRLLMLSCSKYILGSCSTSDFVFVFADFSIFLFFLFFFFWFSFILSLVDLCAHLVLFLFLFLLLFLFFLSFIESFSVMLFLLSFFLFFLPGKYFVYLGFESNNATWLERRGGQLLTEYGAMHPCIIYGPLKIHWRMPQQRSPLRSAIRYFWT